MLGMEMKVAERNIVKNMHGTALTDAYLSLYAIAMLPQTGFRHFGSML